MTTEPFIDAVNDALHRLERKGFGDRKRSTVYVSPRTLDGQGESLYTTTDSVMGMTIHSTRVVPEGVVVIISESRPYDRMMAFARIEQDEP